MVKMRAHPYADYHPGDARRQARLALLQALPLHSSDLGDDFARLRPPHPAVQFLGWVKLDAGGNRRAAVPHSRLVAGGSARLRQLLPRLPAAPVLVARPAAHPGQCAARAAQALGEQVRRAAVAELPAARVIRTDGRITGAVIERDGRRLRIHARRGVVLAAGGFVAQRGDAAPVPAAVRTSRAGAARSRTTPAMPSAAMRRGRRRSTWIGCGAPR